MDFVCNTSTEIEKKTNSKNKDIEDAKARMEKVNYIFHDLIFILQYLILFSAWAIRTRTKPLLEKWR